MPVDFKETKTPLLDKNDGEFADQKLLHICEVCGKQELLTPNEGFEQGWATLHICTLLKLFRPELAETVGLTKQYGLKLP